MVRRFRGESDHKVDAKGRVSIPAPLTKFVMMKSSSEMMNANKNPDIIPGVINGKRIRRKA